MQVEKISNSILYFIILLLGIFVAKLVWQIIKLNSSAQHHPPTSTLINQPSHPTINNNHHLDTLINAQIFGSHTPSQKIATLTINTNISPVKKTALKLRLTGLIKGEHSVAVIIYKGQQRAYSPGDFIVISTHLNVQLDQVQHNYVTIINNGVQERLNLPKLNDKSNANTGISRFSQQQQQQKVSNKLNLDLNSVSLKTLIGSNPRKTITTDPLSLSRFVQISPSINKGKLTGYKIAAGPDKRLLNTAGIHPGDVITHVDGKPVASLTIPAMHSLLQTKSSIQVTLNRQGSVLTMDIRF